MKRLLLTITAMVTLVGCVTAPIETREPLPSTAPTQITRTADPVVRSQEPVVPDRLRLGRVSAPVVPLALTGEALVPPPDPRVVGWWGARAGAVRGSTLLTGHTVHDGGGKFDDLELVPVGTMASVSGVEYKVVWVRIVAKATLAANATRWFSQSGPHRLVLVTCEGYDPATGHYSENVVVMLKPTEGTR